MRVNIDRVNGEGLGSKARGEGLAADTLGLRRTVGISIAGRGKMASYGQVGKMSLEL